MKDDSAITFLGTYSSTREWHTSLRFLIWVNHTQQFGQGSRRIVYNRVGHFCIAFSISKNVLQ